MDTSMKPTSALLFDLGNVLIDVDPMRCFEFWAPFSPHSAEDLAQMPALDKAFEQHEVGEITDLQYFQYLRDLMSLKASDAEIQQGWNAMLGQAIAPTIQMIRRVRKTMPCYVFSNTNNSHQIAWSDEHASIIALFERVFVSNEIALRKPTVEAYAHVINNIQLPAHQILFFDDREDNIAGAKDAGLQTVWVKSSDDVANALGSLQLL